MRVNALQFQPWNEFFIKTGAAQVHTGFIARPALRVIRTRPVANLDIINIIATHGNLPTAQIAGLEINNLLRRRRDFNYLHVLHSKPPFSPNLPRQRGTWGLLWVCQFLDSDRIHLRDHHSEHQPLTFVYLFPRIRGIDSPCQEPPPPGFSNFEK